MLRSSSSSILWSICQSSREQGALYAACRKYAATASESTEPGGFRFAASAYHGRSLAQGAQYLAQTVREALGPQRPPHLLTLLITPESQWGSSITEVPQCIRRLLSYEGAPPPLLIGGVLRKVEAYDDAEAHASTEAAGGQWPAGGAGPGPGGGGPRMVLLAAHMPGVRLAGFHTSTPSLPALPGTSWGEVMQVAAGARGVGTPPPSPPPPASLLSGPLPAACTPGRSAASSGAGACGEGAGAADQGTGGGSSSPSDGSGWGGSVEPSGSVEGSDVIRNRVQGSSTAAGLPGDGRRAAREDSTGAGAGAGATACPESAACLLLSTPHFIELEELLRRFALTVPQMQVVGGVTSPDAWGDTDHSHGAAFLDDATHAQGVVGCVMTGPFKLDVLLTPGFRGAGPVMRVTGSAGQVVTELDGQPVQQPLQRAMSEALNSGEFATSMKIGVGEVGAAEAPDGGSPGSGAEWRPEARPQLVTRNWFFQQGPPRPLLRVFTSGPIAAGTPLQVHLQNYPAAHRDMRDRLRSYAAALPPAAAATHGSVGALALSCSGMPFTEAPDVQRCLPGAAFAGGRVEGEVGSTASGQGTRLHSFSSLLAFIRRSEPAQT